MLCVLCECVCGGGSWVLEMPPLRRDTAAVSLRVCVCVLCVCGVLSLCVVCCVFCVNVCVWWFMSAWNASSALRYCSHISACVCVCVLCVCMWCVWACVWCAEFCFVCVRVCVRVCVCVRWFMSAWNVSPTANILVILSVRACV